MPLNRATLLFAKAGAVGLLTLAACGEPLGPLPDSWSVAAYIPDDYGPGGGFAAGARGAYLTFPFKPGTVYLLADGEIKPDYETDRTTLIGPVGCSGPYVFAGGRRPGPNGIFLAEYDGTRWRELPAVAAGYSRASRIIAVEGETCWLILSPDDGADVLARWDGNELITYPEAGAIYRITYSRATGTLYTWDSFGHVNVSTDGRDWVTEAAAPGEGTWKVEELKTAGTAVADKLHLTAAISANGQTYHGVMSRAGPPGDGVYSLEFMTPGGPYFFGIDGMAFRTPDDGLAVGPKTSLRHLNGDWVYEETGERDFEKISPFGDGPYWALAIDRTKPGGDAEVILRHP